MSVQHVSPMKTIQGMAPAIDQYNRVPGLAYTWPTEVVAANRTLLAEDSGKLFVTSTGAVTFTLPAVTLTGFTASFVNGVDANMTIASAEGDNLIYDGDAAADSLAFSTASHKIGGAVTFISNGTNWVAFVAANGSAVATAAT